VISIWETAYSIISSLTIGNQTLLEKAINENGGWKFVEVIEESVKNVFSSEDNFKPDDISSIQSLNLLLSILDIP